MIAGVWLFFDWFWVIAIGLCLLLCFCVGVVGWGALCVLLHGFVVGVFTAGSGVVNSVG